MSGPADPLFRPSGDDGEDGPTVDPAVAVRVVHGFLRRCRTWGTDLEIPKVMERLAASPTVDDAARLHRWTSFVSFVDHAITELEEGRLDHWFDTGAEL